MDTIIESVRNLLNTVAHWLPQLIGALIILLVGYIIAKAIEKVVKLGLKKASLDKLLHKGTAGSYIEKVVPSPSDLIGMIAFWLIWLGTLSVAVTVLGVPVLTSFVYAIYGYVPNIIAALLIFVVASAIAGGAAALVTRLMGDTPTGKLVATVVPVLTMLIATFMILSQLQIAPAIVTITYAALMGAVALGMALAFGLGGREVASRLLEQAYQAGQAGVRQAKSDVTTAKVRGEHQLRDAGVTNPLEKS